MLDAFLLTAMIRGRWMTHALGAVRVGVSAVATTATIFVAGAGVSSVMAAAVSVT
jgi:hypothetical protein